MLARSPTGAEICSALEIEIFHKSVRTKAPRQTVAADTIDDMVSRHGGPHTIVVLRTIAESDGNDRELEAHTISAVSDIILAHPQWPARGLAWLEAFDAINLPDIVRMAKRMRRVVSKREAIATMLFEQLSEHFGEGPVSTRRSTREERIEFGRLLIEQRSKLPPGHVKRWVADLGISRSTLQRLTKLAREHGAGA